MTNEEYEFILQDRIEKIKSINELYDLEHNSYISYSGGIDSNVTSKLIDLALPNNKIPRIYFNTGIEYKMMLDYVRRKANADLRFQIINSGVNIKTMLTENGYPFKSKQHSHNWMTYNNNNILLDKMIVELKNNPDKLQDYDFIHNLPNGIKTTIKYVFGIREKATRISVDERAL